MRSFSLFCGKYSTFFCGSLCGPDTQGKNSTFMYTQRRNEGGLRRGVLWCGWYYRWYLWRWIRSDGRDCVAKSCPSYVVIKSQVLYHNTSRHLPRPMHATNKGEGKAYLAPTGVAPNLSDSGLANSFHSAACQVPLGRLRYWGIVGFLWGPLSYHQVLVSTRRGLQT